MSTVMEPPAKRLGVRIMQLREEGRWTQRRLAREADVSHEYVRRIEKGIARNVSAEILDRIAHVLGWNDFHQLRDSDALTPPANAEVKAQLVNAWTDEVLSEKVRTELERYQREHPAALPEHRPQITRPIFMQESGRATAGDSRPSPEVVEWQAVDGDRDRPIYSFYVSGDCMDGEVPAGSWVIYDENIVARNDDVVVAHVDGEGYVCKRYFDLGDGRVELRPDDSNFKPIIGPKDRIEVLGVVFQVNKPLRRRRPA